MRGAPTRFIFALAMAGPAIASQARADNILLAFRGLAPSDVVGTRVVGGELTSLKRWPWQVAIYHAANGSTMFECGGSLIADRWVLSAAHCFPDRDKTHYRIVEGSNLMSARPRRAAGRPPT